MKRTSARPRLSAVLKAAIIAAAGALALASCMDRVAGTSVGTGNPTEIVVGFRDDSDASIPVSGSLSVYASTQIPVPGFAPDPLLKVDLSSSRSASLNAVAFAALADSLWPEGSRDGATRLFNVVISGTDRGAVLRGFAFLKDKGAFLLRDEDAAAPRDGGSVSVKGALTSLADYKGTIDTTSLSPFWNYYLFVYGTGFSTKIEHGAFTLPRVPKSGQEVLLIPLPGDLAHSSGIKSTTVFELSVPLVPGENVVSQGKVRDTVPLPDSLIHL
jgi:hypothetical protein